MPEMGLRVDIVPMEVYIRTTFCAISVCLMPSNQANLLVNIYTKSFRRYTDICVRMLAGVLLLITKKDIETIEKSKRDAWLNYSTLIK